MKGHRSVDGDRKAGHRCIRAARAGAAALTLLLTHHPADASPGAKPSPLLRLPLSFEENLGQTDARARFLSRGPGYTLFLTAREAVLDLQSAPAASSGDPTSELARRPVLRVALVGARDAVAIWGEDRLPGRAHYLVGNDPRRWTKDVPLWSRVRYRETWPGIDLVYYGSAEGRLEYDFRVAPGADPAKIRLRFDGADGLALDDDGNLVVRVAGGEVLQKAPVIFQERRGEREPIDGAWRIVSAREATFRLGPWDRTRELVIDPVLSYASFLGGSNTDRGAAIAVDPDGQIYVTGYTTSAAFPTKDPIHGYAGGFSDAFVTKIDSTGSSLVYSTFLGGSENDRGHGIAADADGNAYVGGYTFSTDFPTANPFQAANAGPSFTDGFVTKLDPSGSSLLYSTYLGGSLYDWVNGIAVDGSGSAYVTGQTHSGDFPLENPLVPLRGIGLESFVTKLEPSGSALAYSTWLGGNSDDYGLAIAVDAAGSAHVTGRTHSGNFPAVNAIQAVRAGAPADAFVTKLDPAGSAFVYSTYLGGTGSDHGFGIAIDGAGQAWIAGETNSADFPVVAPVQAAHAGNFDAFVASIAADGSELRFSTWLGGSSADHAYGIASDGSDGIYFGGVTISPDLPTVNPIQPAYSLNVDAFAVKIDTIGNGIVWSTYLGGSGGDEVHGVAADPSGNAYLTGATWSTDFPTVNPLQETLGGSYDSFVIRIGDCGNGLPDDGEACDDGAANGTTGSCCSLTCAFVPAETSCDDGSACTPEDRCDGAGRCVGHDPVVCQALSPCHDAGTCDPGTGICSDPPRSAGSPCDDEDVCTLDDECDGAGACEPGSPTLHMPLANLDQTLECLVQTLSGALP